MPIFLYLTYSNSRSFDFSVQYRRFFSITKSNKNGMGDSKKNRDGAFLFAIPEFPAEGVEPWFLSRKGEAVPLESLEIVDVVRKGAQAIMDRTS